MAGGEDVGEGDVRYAGYDLACICALDGAILVNLPGSVAGLELDAREGVVEQDLGMLVLALEVILFCNILGCEEDVLLLFCCAGGDEVESDVCLAARGALYVVAAVVVQCVFCACGFAGKVFRRAEEEQEARC